MYPCLYSEIMQASVIIREGLSRQRQFYLSAFTRIEKYFLKRFQLLFRPLYRAVGAPDICLNHLRSGSFPRVGQAAAHFNFALGILAFGLDVRKPECCVAESVAERILHLGIILVISSIADKHPFAVGYMLVAVIVVI